MRQLRPAVSRDVELAREVAAIDAEREAAFAALRAANAAGEVGARTWMATIADLDARMEAVRARWFPRSAQVIIALGCLQVVSANRASARLVELPSID